MEMMSKAMVGALLEMHERPEPAKESLREDLTVGRVLDRQQGRKGNRKQRRAAAAVACKNARRVTA